MPPCRWPTARAPIGSTTSSSITGWGYVGRCPLSHVASPAAPGTPYGVTDHVLSPAPTHPGGTGGLPAGGRASWPHDLYDGAVGVDPRPALVDRQRRRALGRPASDRRLGPAAEQRPHRGGIEIRGPPTRVAQGGPGGDRLAARALLHLGVQQPRDPQHGRAHRA